eukprot:TRINITY_DN2533_c0_g1_i1.p1 TRINITY_DN2533_c0_g1~~TRINITY_DN2533_c0_g1_i1.p1  ORF type:complete len:281 (+),score=54.33 TRINITY_DN2533_c0_g1_i1:14-856(+)
MEVDAPVWRSMEDALLKRYECPIYAEEEDRSDYYRDLLDISNCQWKARSNGIFVVAQDGKDDSSSSISSFPRFGYTCRFRRAYYLHHLTSPVLNITMPDVMVDIIMSFLEPALLSVGDVFELQAFGKRVRKKVLSAKYEPTVKITLEAKPVQQNFKFDVSLFNGRNGRYVSELYSYQDIYESLPVSMIAFDSENIQNWLIVMFTPKRSKYLTPFLHFQCEFPNDYPSRPPRFWLLHSKKNAKEQRIEFQLAMFKRESWAPLMSLSVLLQAIQVQILEGSS